MKHVIFVDQQELLELAKKQLSKEYPAGFELVIVPTEDVQKEEPNPILWYPDDGEWIPVPSGCGMPDSLCDTTKVDILIYEEQKRKFWTSYPSAAKEFNWQASGDARIVAYKVVEKDGPWYPDNSGEWIECNGVRPVGLSGNTEVEVLIQTERNDKNWVSCADCVDEWLWETIVAYKVV